MEPYVFKINCEVDFDGTTPIEATLSDFTQTSGRVYEITLPAAGVIKPDIFGTFSEGAAKIVGIAGDSFSPLSSAAVRQTGQSNMVRQLVDMTPRLQHVGMMPTDELTIVTQNVGRSVVYLTVNAMSEAEHQQFARDNPMRDSWRRFRIRRNDSSGWTPTHSLPSFLPDFSYNNSTNIMEVVSNVDGPIPVRSLCLYPNYRGCFLSVRYTNNSAAGKVHIFQPDLGRNVAVVPALAELVWSKVIYASHDDHIELETPGVAAGTDTIADIEVIAIEPEDRFNGRYTFNI